MESFKEYGQRTVNFVREHMIDYSPHPWSRIFYGACIFNFAMGTYLSSIGYSTLAIMSYALSGAGYFFGMENRIDEVLDEREAGIQDLFEAEERLKASGMEDLIKVVDSIDKAYEAKLEERIERDN